MVPTCSNYRLSSNVKTLNEPETYEAALFTLREGSLPVFATSFRCSSECFWLILFKPGVWSFLGCKCRYYPNYYVTPDSKSRVYYPGVPRYIQASQHAYFDVPLLEFFTTTNVFGWCVQWPNSYIFKANITHLLLGYLLWTVLGFTTNHSHSCMPTSRTTL